MVVSLDRQTDRQRERERERDCVCVCTDKHTYIHTHTHRLVVVSSPFLRCVQSAAELMNGINFVYGKESSRADEAPQVLQVIFIPQNKVIFTWEWAKCMDPGMGKMCVCLCVFVYDIRVCIHIYDIICIYIIYNI